jgi:hypothetical protein
LIVTRRALPYRGVGRVKQTTITTGGSVPTVTLASSYDDTGFRTGLSDGNSG